MELLQSSKSVMTFHGGKELYPLLLPPTAGHWKVVGTHRGTGKWVPPERGCEERENFKARSQRNVVGIPTASLKIGGDLFVHPICVVVEILS